tara:strand:- start:533 stop:1060 length:528 start_codon:yes stop_codon:yes gene_type:complete
MMESTKSYVTVYDISLTQAEDFEFTFSTGDSEILRQLVPNMDDWGELAWGVELEEYEYNRHNEQLYLVLETKGELPVQWLRNASMGTAYFQNKLITMTTIQNDETTATGVAIMDGDVLQSKGIWSMEPEEVGKYYDDDSIHYELDSLDNQIWDSISHFRNVCEQFYLGKGPEEND